MLVFWKRGLARICVRNTHPESFGINVASAAPSSWMQRLRTCFSYAGNFRRWDQHFEHLPIWVVWMGLFFGFVCRLSSQSRGLVRPCFRTCQEWRKWNGPVDLEAKWQGGTKMCMSPPEAWWACCFELSWCKQMCWVWFLNQNCLGGFIYDPTTHEEIKTWPRRWSWRWVVWPHQFWDRITTDISPRSWWCGCQWEANLLGINNGFIDQFRCAST